MQDYSVIAFATLPAPRWAGYIRHRFYNLLVIAVYTVMAGAETWVDIADFRRIKYIWLAPLLDLPHGSSSHDIRRVFSLVDPQELG